MRRYIVLSTNFTNRTWHILYACSAYNIYSELIPEVSCCLFDPTSHPGASIPIQGRHNVSPVKNREGKYGNDGIWERGETARDALRVRVRGFSYPYPQGIPGLGRGKERIEPGCLRGISHCLHPGRPKYSN